jgi:prevent-host-death family protein
MRELPISRAREHLAETVEGAVATGEPVLLTRRGRPVAVIVDADAYRRLVAASEDAADLAELEAARAEDDFIPWEDVKRDLGLL